MHKTLRFALVFAYLFTVAAWGPASARASASALTLTVSPSQFYVYDVENFLTVSGASRGQVSTIVTYTNGNSVFEVEPQPLFSDPDNPSQPDPNVPLAAWVPFEVGYTVGQWEVRVIATGVEGSTVYGPASLDIIERQEGDLPPSLPEVVVLEAGVDTFTFDAGGASCDVESGSTLVFGTTRVTCTFAGVNYWFDAVLTDSTPPVVTVPENIDTLNHVVTWTTSAVDNLDGPLTPVCSPLSSGAEFPDGETLVHCGVQDSFGNEGGGFFLVTVGPPVFHLSGDSTTEATEPGGAVVTYDATVGNGTITCSPASGALFPVTTTTVNCSAQNAVASSTTAFLVSVVDTTPPSLMAPGNFTVDSASLGGTVVSYTTMSSDIVDGTIVVLCSPASGSTFPVGTTLVECSATDAHSNESTGSFSVTVNYNPPPVPVLTDAGARVWLGLKDNANTGKKNTTFDLLVEVLHNGTVVGSGQTDGVGGGPGFGNAVLRSVDMAVASTPINPGDMIGVRVSVRIAANSASSSATARLWINDAGANSSVNVVIQGVTTTTYTDYFLNGGSVLGAVGSGPKLPIDVDVDRNVDGNAFKPFGVWTVQY